MHIEIEKNEIPYTFEIEWEEELYTFEINYNERFDFFTIGLSKDDEVVVAGEKMVLNQPLFYQMSDDRLPKVLLIPTDESGTAERITYDNLGKSVFLQIGELVEWQVLYMVESTT